MPLFLRRSLGISGPPSHYILRCTCFERLSASLGFANKEGTGGLPFTSLYSRMLRGHAFESVCLYQAKYRPRDTWHAEADLGTFLFLDRSDRSRV